MIRFSCSDYTFPLLPRAQRFALLQLLGFKYVDIGLFERSTDLSPSQLGASPRAFIKELKSDLERSALQVSDVFLQTGEDPAAYAANDSRPSVRSRNHKTFMLALDLCTALGCTHLTGLPGVWHKGAKQADDLALAVEEACWRQRAASDAGVSCAIARTRALLDSVPGLTLTLDYGHFVFANIQSREIHALLPYASHIHVRGAAPKKLQTPMSENQIDFGGMMRRLYQQKYSGFLAVEYGWVDWEQCNRTDNVSETNSVAAPVRGI
jgi:sugar phosphate isomerase/epimerase